MTETPIPEPKTLRGELTATWPGRILLAILALRGLLWLLKLVAGPREPYASLEVPVQLLLALALGYFIVRLIVLLRRDLLWRVRRRLVLSYVFLGVLPVGLLGLFFLAGGLLFAFEVGTYLFRQGANALVDETRIVARAVASDLERAQRRAITDVLPELHRQHASQFPSLSIAMVPFGGQEEPAAAAPMSAGGWAHGRPPARLPEWISVGGFQGVLVGRSGPDEPQLTIRAVEVVNLPAGAFAVVADLPFDELALDLIKERSGVDARVLPVAAGPDEVGPAFAAAPQEGGPAGASQALRWWRPRDWLRWDRSAVLPTVDWSTGRRTEATMALALDLADVYVRVSSGQADTSAAGYSRVLPLALGVVALLLFIVQAAALIMGLTLARSITGSVDALFVGTERVMQGDFSHRIRIETRDQLGELAISFNRMTASVEDMLQEMAEKRRLQEELRIARQIQMSLLPPGPLQVRGLAVSALCVPAREVGGDYYDFFELNGSRVGLLIADVAGKGTSAALYMAELKGLMLSLSQIHDSPRALVVAANRILSANVASRSFITMTYAIVDPERRTLTYVRAGHTPLIRLTGGGTAERHANLHTPDGLVVGLALDNINEMFESSLEERTLPLDRGDVFVLYTDGVTDAMNAESDLFGDERLRQAIEDHGHLPPDQLRERIVREIEAFVGGAEQHDDLTMILVKVESVARVHEPAPLSAS
jgi:sigma-B regulation protein RsbU (phosphoserine phosphatase)